MTRSVRGTEEYNDDDEDEFRRAKTPYELQRMRLNKLIANIDKPAPIPAPRTEWKPPPPPEFVRNVVGSSAGAGSGEYHIYRNIRKKENQRIQFIEQQALKEKLDREFQEKLEKRKREAEEKTARNRAKRLKKKKKMKERKKRESKGVKEEPESDSESNSSENDEHKEQNTEDAAGVEDIVEDFRESECKVEAEQQYEVLQDKDSAKEVADKKNHVTKE